MQDHFRKKLWKSLDLVVLSPGVPTDLPVVEKIRESREFRSGERVELAYQAWKR